MNAPTARIGLSAEGLEIIREIAARNGVTPRQYMEALMHYAISTERRPGSWEGCAAFDLRTYCPWPGQESYADRWF